MKGLSAHLWCAAWLWLGVQSVAAAAGDRRKVLQIVPYVGYGTPARVVAFGRVLKPRPLKQGVNKWERMYNNALRLMTSEKANLPIEVRVGRASAIGATNKEGHFRVPLSLLPGVPVVQGFVQGTVALGPSSKYRAERVPVRFVVPTARSRFGVISDVDDTVLVTNVLDKAQMLREAMFGDAASRQAFPGCAEFYQGLRAGRAGNEYSPLFYVSGSPWNIHDILADAFENLGIPRGPLRLRDFGVGKEADPLLNIKAFKRPRIRRILDTYPAMRFVLIGDSGQTDAELYADLATHARYRDRILAVYIRNVNPPADGDRRKELATLRDRVGPHFVVFGNTLAAADHAASNGLISDAARRSVQEATTLSGALTAGARTRYPIVLVHGLLGFSHMGIEDFGAITYFRHIRPHLEEHGFRVIVVELGMTDGVAARAQQLKEWIERSTAGKVNLIAHSMGGLDSRYMIAHLGMSDRVASLTTVATPHRGSSFADWGIENVGSAAPLLKALGVGTDAFFDLTSKACDRLNASAPNAPGVRYFSYSGTQRRGDVYGGLRVSYDIITQREGPNDGLVSQRSARWGEYLGNVDADHLNLVGWRFLWEYKERFDAKKFYLDMARMLQREGL